MFSSDRGHIHHRLMDRGLSHKGAVLALYGIAIVLAGVAVALFHSDAGQTLAFSGAVAAIAALLLIAGGYLRFGKGKELAADRRSNLGMRTAVRRAGEQIRKAEELEAIWEAVREVAVELKASCASLLVVVTNGSVRRTEFSWGFDEAPSGMLQARFSLLGERPDEGCIVLGFSDGRQRLGGPGLALMPREHRRAWRPSSSSRSPRDVSLGFLRGRYMKRIISHHGISGSEGRPLRPQGGQG